MIYKTFEEWKTGQWLEDGEPRTKAYTKDELLLVEMGWQYGFDAGKEVKELTDVEIHKEFLELVKKCDPMLSITSVGFPDLIVDFAKAILRKAQEK